MKLLTKSCFLCFFYWFKKPQLDSHYIPGISPLWYFIFPVYLHQQDLIIFPGRLSPALADILRRPWLGEVFGQSSEVVSCDFYVQNGLTHESYFLYIYINSQKIIYKISIQYWILKSPGMI